MRQAQLSLAEAVRDQIRDIPQSQPTLLAMRRGDHLMMLNCATCLDTRLVQVSLNGWYDQDCPDCTPANSLGEWTIWPVCMATPHIGQPPSIEGRSTAPVRALAQRLADDLADAPRTWGDLVESGWNMDHLRAALAVLRMAGQLTEIEWRPGGMTRAYAFWSKITGRGELFETLWHTRVYGLDLAVTCAHDTYDWTANGDRSGSGHTLEAAQRAAIHSARHTALDRGRV